MTVNNSANKVIAACNGVQTVFNFSFIAVAASDLQAILTDSSGNETSLLPASYTVALNPTEPGQIWSLGGNVTYPLTGSPAPNGSTLTIVRNLSLTQLVALGNQGNEFPSAVETALDLIEMQLQQVNELFQRAIVAPVVDPSAPLPLPPVAQRANQGMGFDASGNPVAIALPASGVISTAMQPVVAAASLALGRAAFGLGGIAVEGIGAGLQDDGNGNVRVQSVISQVATSQNVTAAFAQNVYIASGPINFTLARADTLWNGFSFEMFVLAGPVTLVPNANDSVQGQSSGAAVAIPANSYARVTCDGATSGNWHVEWAPWNVDGASKAMIGPVAFGAVRGLTIVNDAATPNTKIDVAAIECVMVNSAGYGIKQPLAFTIDLTTGTGTSAANGMDGEAIPGAGWLYVWAISNGATSAGLASTSSTVPTLPAGYTFKKYLGAMRTASSILLRTRQVGSRAVYTPSTGSNTTVPPVIGATLSGSQWTALSVSNFVPPTASEIKVIVNMSSVSANGFALAPNNNYPAGGFNTASNIISVDNTSASGIVLNMMVELTLESSNIYYGTSNAQNAVSCYGWTDSNV